MDTAMLVAPTALIALVLWFTLRTDDSSRAAVVPLPVERVRRSLKERLARGEINADEFRRLTALMQLPE